MILEKADIDLILTALYEYSDNHKSHGVTEFADKLEESVSKICDSSYDQLAEEMPLVQLKKV